MTIQEKIEQLKKEFADKIAELEKQAKEEEKQNRVWKPTNGEEYWFLSGDGVEYDTWGDNYVDDDTYKRGNIFKTEEEAEWADDHRIVATELKRFVAENDPRPITEEDWGNGDILKHSLGFNCDGRKIEAVMSAKYRKANQVYASSPVVLKKAIEHIGEEHLKKYYFGVE